MRRNENASSESTIARSPESASSLEEMRERTARKPRGYTDCGGPYDPGRPRTLRGPTRSPIRGEIGLFNTADTNCYLKVASAPRNSLRYIPTRRRRRSVAGRRRKWLSQRGCSLSICIGRNTNAVRAHVANLFAGISVLFFTRNFSSR